MSLDLREFQGVNEGYLLERYDRFRIDPQSVSAEERDLFARWTPPDEAMDSPAAMAPWARLALEAALRSRAAKSATAKKKRPARPSPARGRRR